MVVQTPEDELVPEDELDLVEEPNLGEVDFTPQGTDDFDDRFLLEEEPDDADDIYRHQNSGGISDLVDQYRDMNVGLAEEIPVDENLFDLGSPRFDDEQIS